MMGLLFFQHAVLIEYFPVLRILGIMYHFTWAVQRHCVPVSFASHLVIVIHLNSLVLYFSLDFI